MDSKLQFRDLELVGEDAYPKLVLFKLMAYWQLLEILGVSITAVLGPWWAQFVKQHLGATITGKEERLLVAEWHRVGYVFVLHQTPWTMLKLTRGSCLRA